MSEDVRVLTVPLTSPLTPPATAPVTRLFTPPLTPPVTPPEMPPLTPSPTPVLGADCSGARFRGKLQALSPTTAARQHEITTKDTINFPCDMRTSLSIKATRS